MTAETFIRGWALALRDLAETDDEAVSTSVTFATGAVMSYAKGRGAKVSVPAGQVLTIPEDALDDVGLVPADDVVERTAKHLDVLADALATPGNGSRNP